MNRGSAYIMVLITMMSMFIILATLLYTGRYEMDISRIYKETGNLYSLAESGVTQAMVLLESRLNAKQYTIIRQLISELKTAGIRGISEYNTQTSEFFINNDILKSKISTITDTHMTSGWTGENIEYELSFTDEQNENYKVSVAITPNLSKRPYVYNVEALATKDGMDISELVSATIRLNFNDINCKVMPRYKWLNVPDWAFNTTNTSYSTTSGALTVTALTNNWSNYNPIDVTDSSVTDISSFYISGQPIPTAIICLDPNIDLRITANNSFENQFNGIIFSAGNIEIDSIVLTGSVISAKDILINENVYLNSDHDMLFKIKIEDSELKGQLLDFFSSSNFAHADNSQNIAAANILVNLDVFEPSLELIQDWEFEIVHIRKEYE